MMIIRDPKKQQTKREKKIATVVYADKTATDSHDGEQMLSSFTFHHEGGTKEERKKKSIEIHLLNVQRQKIFTNRHSNPASKIMKMWKEIFFPFFDIYFRNVLFRCCFTLPLSICWMCTQDPPNERRSFFLFGSFPLPVVVLKYFISPPSENGKSDIASLCLPKKTYEFLLHEDVVQTSWRGSRRTFFLLKEERNLIFILLIRFFLFFQLAVQLAAARKTDTAISRMSACKYPESVHSMTFHFDASRADFFYYCYIRSINDFFYAGEKFLILRWNFYWKWI